MKTNKNKLLMKLFFITFYVSAFTFGGGFVIITLMKKKFVDELAWINEDEMLDLAAIAQSCPGAIAVNASILVGYQIAGFIGTMIAVLGTIIPPMAILSVISFFYTAFKDNQIIALILKGMQAGVAAVILDVVLNLGKNVVKSKDMIHILIMIIAFIATYFFHINVIFIIAITLFIGTAKALLFRKGEGLQ